MLSDALFYTSCIGLTADTWSVRNILKMKAACSSEMLVYNQNNTQFNNPGNYYLNCCLFSVLRIITQ
jgi:hypothetical protein